MRVAAWKRRSVLAGLRHSTLGAGVAAGALTAPLLLAPQALPQNPAPPTAPSVVLGYPVTAGRAPVPKPAAKPRDAAATTYVPSAVHWPAAHAATATLASPAGTAAAGGSPAAGTARTAAGAKGYASGTPVWGQALAQAGAGYQGPAGVGVSVADHAAALKAGVSGVLFSAAPSGAGRGPVRLGVDYASFAQAYGGNYGSRLRLVQLPACALSTPQVAACRRQTLLGSVNDPVAKSVSAQVTLGASGNAPNAVAGAAPAASSAMVLALTASPSSGDGGGNAGSYAATTLKPAGSWSVGGSSGSFTYSYPITIPPAASTLVPTVALSYDSGSVDGQTAATQSQSDWLGDGWSTPENYIEQSFVSCADSPEGSAAPQATGDTCYDGPILTLSLNGSSTSLVCGSNCTSADAIWKPATDNGDIVTHVTGSGNGSGTSNTDYWTVTDRTGTAYSFGLNHLPGWTSGAAATNSVQSEPVYSAHSGDPCYNATWSSSWCTMGYRWNLDYVKDLHGNAMGYYYQQDTNAYAQNDNTTSATAYVRDSHLDHIDYGFTDGDAYGTVPDKVLFTTGDRCVSGTCDPLNTTNAANWPDVPYDLNCAASAACQITGPSMWSTVRLTGISTEQYNGSGYTPVDSYSFAQSMPAPGDGTAATLWLESITRTGGDTTAGGSAVTLPPVSFTSVQEANRVDTTTDGLAALERYRISGVTTETGSVITVNYELVNPCTAPVTLNPASNTSSCYPVYWTPQGASSPLLDWFNKYTVSSVAQSDPSGGSAGLKTSYTYLNGAAWHYDDNEVVQAKYRTYGQYRGYGDVQTFTGQGSDPLTESEATYYRGMSDDNNSTAVTLTDSQGGAHDDTNQLAGNTLETTSYDYAGGPITGSSIDSYWVSAPTASRARTGLPALTANATGQVETWTRTALTDTGTTAWRTTESDTSYDANTADATFALPTIVYQHGDLALSGNSQQRCTVTTYAPANSGSNLVGLAAEVETDADPCGGTNPGGSSAPTAAQTNALTAPAAVNRPADVVADTRTFYDLQPPGSTSEPTTTPAWPQAAAVYGDLSETQSATGYTGGAFTYQVKSAGTNDSYGRPLDAWDALGHETQIAYTMTNAVTTAAATTNALGQSTSTSLDPLRGAPVSTTDPNGVTTVTDYDGLGRKTAVWNDSRPTTATPNYAYSYTLGTSTTPTVVTTQTLNEESQASTSTALYDALLRPRQTQAPTPQGGRLVSDVFYDTHGWTAKTNTEMWDTSATPNATLFPVDDKTVRQQTLTSYDGLGRPVEVQSKDNASTPTIDNITYTQYTGDKTLTVPPTGATATATVTDALGRTTELDQYTSAPTVSATTTNAITTVSITGGATQATDYLFNNTGQQTDVKDASTGADWNTTYNLLGQATAKNDPDAGPTTNISYDPDGNLLQSTDSRGKTLSYTYDALNRKTGQYDAPVTGQSSANQLAAWVYDNSNNAVSGMTHPLGQLTTETAYVGGNAYTTQATGFNVFGEPLGQTITIPASEGKLAGTYTFGQTYTPTTGLPSLSSYPSAGGLAAETVTTGYTTRYNLDLPNTLGSLSGYLHATTYTAYGQVAQLQLANTTTSTLADTYDPHTGELTDAKVTNTLVSATPIDETAYTYDPAGNPTSQTETRQGTQTENQCYQYDPLDRLTQAWTATDQCATTPTTSNDSMVGDGITGGAYWTSYSLDSLGQRTRETDHSLTAGTADTTTTYTYGGSAPGCTTTSNGLHTLASTSTTSPSGTSSNTYCYDQAGNTTQRNTTATGQQSLTWNDLGQLTAVTTASAGSSYLYDAQGNLLEQKDPGTTTLYLPGEQLALNTTTNTVTATRFYTLPGGAQVVRTGTGSNYSFQITDQHNTSTLTLSNTLTNPVWRQQTPYGAARGTTPTTWPDNHGFLNKPQDTATGLTDVGARWYDPATGRFTSLDPLFETTSPQQQNGYTYAGDNPITYSDPTGRSHCDIASCPNDPSAGNPDPTGGGCGEPGFPACPKNENGDSGSSGSGGGGAAPSPAPVVVGGIAFPSSYQYLPGIQLAFKNGWNYWNHGYNVPHTPYNDLQALYAGCMSGTLNEDIALCGSDVVNMLERWHDQLITVAGGMGVSPGFPWMVSGGAGAGAPVDGEPQALYEDSVSTQEKISAAVGGCNSFAGTTAVLMADGTSKPIDQIKPGDKIANNLPGADPGTKDQAHTVTAIHITYTDRDYTDVTIATPDGAATITGTAHHPYWDQTTHAWTDADHLHTGDQLQTPDGHAATILALRDYSATMVTYNLTLDTLHTYYVLAGNTPVLVHNAGGPGCDITAMASNVDPENIKMTQTVANHLGDYLKDGRMARPYMNSPLTIQEVMDGSTPVLDPGGVPGALRWDTPGTFRGSAGTWELVVNTETNTMLHFNFVSGG